MKITEYTQASAFDNGDVLLKDGVGGTKIISAADLLLAAVDAAELTQMHRNIYRGKNLGTSLTAAQKAAIAAQTWDDLFIGDYWVIGGHTWRIADINYWLHTGDTECTTPHLVIVNDDNLGNQKMEDTNITTNGYYGSKFVTTYMASALAAVTSAFGDNVLEHRALLTTASSNGHASAFAWQTRKADIMTETMVYGSKIIGAMGDGSFVAYNHSVDKSQLALFALKPDAITTRYTYWLQDIVSATSFATVNHDGNAGNNYASTSNGVRLAFPIHG